MYFDATRPVTEADRALIDTRWNTHEAALFEQLMLFEKISFKVYGENMLIPALIRMLGMRGFEELIEQKAIGFTLWTTDITFHVTELPGIEPLQFVIQNGAPHTDPETSIMHGFKWMRAKLSYDERRRLVRKITPLYRTVPNTFSLATIDIVRSAYQSGKLNAIGMDTTQDYQRLPFDARRQLCACGAEVLEYSYLLSQKMTSYSNPSYFALFNDTAAHVRSKDTLSNNFQALASIEGFPDLAALRSDLKIPLSKLPKLRQKRSAKQFREWLATTSYSSGDVRITKEYIDAIANRKGFFETNRGKVIKSIAMTIIGAGASALVAKSEGPLLATGIGAAAASAVGKALDYGADFALDMADEFAIGEWTKGWTPQMFFEDLRKLPPFIALA